MNSTDIIKYDRIGFDNEKYVSLQSDAILKRLELFKNGRLYLEVGGKLLFDPHAARVLPGFQADNKVRILKKVIQHAEVIFCFDAGDIVDNRQLTNKSISYIRYALDLLTRLEATFFIKPIIVINRCPHEVTSILDKFVARFDSKGYTVYKRYHIEGYPKNLDIVLSDQGFGKDDYIKLKKDIVIVTGPAANSGKLSTCLGQIYFDTKQGLTSGYAKYETFPIWNLSINHPVNIAYEAATADIGDYNMVDTFHKEKYGATAINYNRDLDAFLLLKQIVSRFLPKTNPLHKYFSPTDMGINFAGSAIINDALVREASISEIERRILWYSQLVTNETGEKEWVTRCKELLVKAKRNG